jgi:hypothetical protein
MSVPTLRGSIAAAKLSSSIENRSAFFLLGTNEQICERRRIANGPRKIWLLAPQVQFVKSGQNLTGEAFWITKGSRNAKSFFFKGLSKSILNEFVIFYPTLCSLANALGLTAHFPTSISPTHDHLLTYYKPQINHNYIAIHNPMLSFYSRLFL